MGVAYKMKVLIAEDDAIVRKILRDNLKLWGYEPIVTKDGQEAMNIINSRNFPSVVILDWFMPYVDGIDICRKIRSIDRLRYTYIIMLTGRDADSCIIQGLEAGVDDYIVKPVKIDEFKYRLKIADRIIQLENNVLELASLDYLTRLLNRRFFMLNSGEKIDLIKNNKDDFSVAMLDIDNFKIVNDTYGHSSGDKVLKSIAKILKDSCRENEIIGRYGGEEFIIFFSNIDKLVTRLMAERIRKNINGKGIFLEDYGKSINVSVSIGIASCNKKEYDIDDIIKKADFALYKAKEAGKNIVIDYDDIDL